MASEQCPKYEVLKEAIERADQLIAVQDRYLRSQDLLVDQLTARIRKLESELAEFRCQG